MAWGSSSAYPGQETTRRHIAFLYIGVLPHCLQLHLPVLSIKFFNVYAQEFQSAHVHNDLSNFQKADGVAVTMGHLSQLPNHHS